MLESVAMTPRIDTKKIVTISTAIKKLKISRQAAWDAVASGRLETVEIDDVTFVTLKSVQQYLKTRRPRGPKPKRKN
jgi:ribosomal protein S11